MTQQRKPAVYLAVIVPVMLGGALVVAAGMYLLYANVHGPDVPPVNGILITLPALALWVPAGLLLSNVALFTVPSLRRTAEDYSARNSTPSFKDSQAQLGRLTAIMSVICLPLIALGFYL